MLKWPALWLIRLYQMTLSRILPPSCRFTPSCSHYTYEAIAKHGLFKGGWLGVQRISRCHPMNPGGYDPVPDTFTFTPGLFVQHDDPAAGSHGGHHHHDHPHH